MKPSLVFAFILAMGFTAFSQNQSARFYLEKAKELKQEYAFEEMVALLEGAIGAYPQNTEIQLELGAAYEKTGRLKAVRQLYQAMLDADTANVEVLMRLGKLNTKLRDYKAGLECFERLAQLNPDNAYFHKLAGEVARQVPQLLPAAINHYQKARTLNPKDQETGHDLASLYLDLNQFASGRAITQTFLKEDSAQRQLLLLDMRLAYLQQQWPDVVQSGNYLLTNGDSIPSALRLYGIALYNLGQYSQAINWLNFLAKNHSSEQVYFYLGMAHYRLDRQDSAEYFLQKAITQSQSPSRGTYHTQLAIVNELQENYPAAIKNYRMAYELNANENLLYRLARVTDEYYQDKKVAEAYYEQFLEKTDTAETPQRIYSRERVSEMKRVRFFKKDTI